MSDENLARKYRLWTAAFGDDPARRDLLQQLGPSRREVLGLFAEVLTHDLGVEPEDLDRQRIEGILGVFLPGRLTGREPYLSQLPDVLLEFLLFVGRESGVERSWEWTSAVEEHRDDLAAACANPGRPRFGSPAASAPDRRPAPKIGRNDPCFCGSGRKFKVCCGKLVN